LTSPDPTVPAHHARRLQRHHRAGHERRRHRIMAQMSRSTFAYQQIPIVWSANQATRAGRHSVLVSGGDRQPALVRDIGTARKSWRSAPRGLISGLP
jgi:hypothetical protein